MEVAVNTTDIEWMKQTLKEIKAEVKKTNGRVSKLELWKARSVGMIIGAAAVFSFIFAVVKSLFGL